MGAILAFGVLFAASNLAWADDPDAPPAAPKTGLETALADAEAGRFADACPAIRRSYREDPRASTLFQLAECYRKWGRIATAAVHYEDYLAAYDKLTDTEQKDERAHEEIASKQRELIEKQIPKVVLRVPRDAPETTRVLRRPQEDGPPIPVAIGVPLLIDPGEHVLTTEVPGRASVFTKFSVKVGENKTVEVEIPPASGKIDPTNKAKPLQPVPSMMPVLDPGISGRRVAAYALGGVGAVGILGGLVSGVITWGQKPTIEKNCMSTNTKICNPTGVGAKTTATVTGWISQVTLPIGLVAVGTGAFLYYTEPPPSKFNERSSTPQIRLGLGPTSGSIQIQW